MLTGVEGEREVVHSSDLGLLHVGLGGDPAGGTGVLWGLWL